jgi:hypothetical protein
MKSRRHRCAAPVARLRAGLCLGEARPAPAGPNFRRGTQIKVAHTTRRPGRRTAICLDLDLGEPARIASVGTMARRADKATGSCAHLLVHGSQAGRMWPARLAEMGLKG